MTDFEINEHGYWENNSLEGHYHDPKLALAIALLLKNEGLRTAVDFGCGPGNYVRDLRKKGIEILGYDGNPFTKHISEKVLNDGSFCEQLDLTKETNLEHQFDCVISLEVGEHIPAKYEDIFIRNLANHSKRVIILSWAVGGQNGRGHVNCRSNEYVINKLKTYHFEQNDEATFFLRNFSTLSWFKKTVMVFEKVV